MHAVLRSQVIISAFQLSVILYCQKMNLKKNERKGKLHGKKVALRVGRHEQDSAVGEVHLCAPVFQNLVLFQTLILSIS